MPVVRPSTLVVACLLAAGCGSSRSPEPEAAAAVSCTRCHGDPLRASAGGDPLIALAPPRAASGDAGDPTIGAHLAHLGGGALSRPVACNTCHVIPDSVESHTRGSPVVFSGLAKYAWAGAPAIAPVYARGSGALTCAATYCHGAFPNGNAANLPHWAGGPSQAACGTCHGLPPATRSAGGTHPDVAAASCGSCHDGYSGTTVNLALHVNGQVDSTLSCTSCHGDAARTGADAGGQALAPAPPRDSAGSTTGTAVGAHLRHLTSPRFSRAVACGECHQGAIPTAMDHANGVVQVAFGPLARTAPGAAGAPAFDGTAVGCSATYCHGNFANGLGANPVSWNGPAATCTSCHGVPPVQRSQGGTHPDVSATDCGRCHPGFTATTTNAAVHVNGLVEAQLSCTSCHGDPQRAGRDAANQPLAPAPPTDASGSPAGAAVGAHLAHLLGPRFSKPVACGECHVVPTALDHANGTANVTFGPLARNVLFGGGTIAPVWSAATTGCSATYCHGNFRNGLGANPISWGGGHLICVSCHGLPPRTAAEGGTHPNDLRCGNCHPVTNLGLPVPATHVDGKVDFVP